MFQSNLTTPEKPVLVLRVCQSTGHSRNNFYWPQSGPVNCPDWADNKECGNGLHGWLHGVGNGYAANGRLLKNVNSLWLVVEVPSYIDLGDKVKFPSGTVVFSGTQEGATKYLRDNDELIDYKGKPVIIGNILTVGDNEVGTGGDYSKVTSGIHGTSNTGDFSTATTGDFGTATSGDFGISISGRNGVSGVSSRGHAASGVGGTIMVYPYGINIPTTHTIGIDVDVFYNTLIPNQLYCFSYDGEPILLS